MNRRNTILLVSLVIASLLFGNSVHASRADIHPQFERVKLSKEDTVLFEYLLDRISRDGSVPTLDEMEIHFSHPIEENARATISAKLFYERGIVGALLTDHETTTLHLLLRQRRRLGSLGELADRIRDEFHSDVSTFQVLRSLEFLYTAGYIDVRDDGKCVYMILPKDVEALYFTSSIQREMLPIDPFEKTVAELSEAHTRKEGIAPETIEKPHRLPDPQLSILPSKTTGPLPIPPDTQVAALKRTPAHQPGGQREDRTQEDTPEKLSQEPSPEDVVISTTPQVQKVQKPTESKPLHMPDMPEPESNMTSQRPLGPPSPPVRRQQPEKDEEGSTGFSVETMKTREKSLLPCAPDFWGWPYLYGQDNYEILSYTTDTGSEVRITVKDGRLISYTPSDIIVFNEGQHGDIRFFRSEHNLHLWQRDVPNVHGTVMTLPEAISWARKNLQSQ
jgi:hypothetical protein